MLSKFVPSFALHDLNCVGQGRSSSQAEATTLLCRAHDLWNVMPSLRVKTMQL